MLPTSTPERPIQKKEEDQLGRARFVERLTLALVNSETRKSTGVIVGITGAWGSGKSSLLNLLKERLQEKYPDALIVRFDPWLVSGRNDLIAEFLGEIIGTINADEKRRATFKKIGGTIAEYGGQLAPLGSLFMPGLGAMLKGGFQAAAHALKSKESLSLLRSRLIKELQEADAPVVVLIDELDRVEDDEIRTVAQLVRSVLDFPGISYVLAYDPERVIQALGSGSGDEQKRLERGRSYLEKIVQLQIPIPITFPHEITRLLISELASLQGELKLPPEFQRIERFDELIQLLAPELSPRDIRRLVGTFHVLAGMLQGEVDWIDLLAFSALLTKAPGTIENMRRYPENFSDDLHTRRSFAAHARELDNKPTLENRLKLIVPVNELNDGTKNLLGFIFPSLSEDQVSAVDHPDALYKRRPLLTTLRLGLLPGAFSRDKVLSLFKCEPQEIKSQLQEAYDQDALDPLTDRIEELYDLLPVDRAVQFWRGVAAFAAKSDCEWLRQYNPMHEKVANLVGILETAVRRDNAYRITATKVFAQLKSDGDNELVAYWIRSHLFAHSLLGHREQSSEKWFLDVEQTRAMAAELTTAWRSLHLSNKLIPCRWDLQPVYTMLDTGMWDEPCRARLNEALIDDVALDGLTLMLYGGPYTVGRDTVGKICELELYVERAKARLGAGQRLDSSVRVAFEKALGRGAY
jgi:energy-coupling factor transporter ATP-binding protein EcfA2